MADFATIALSGLVLPPDCGLARDFARPADRRTPDYETRYDRLTLAYDHWLQDGRLHLLCPRLLNLWPLMRDSLGRPRRYRHLRWELLTLPAPGPRRLSHGGLDLPLAPGAPLQDHFAGLRVLMAVSRNNDLDWIADWARFHQRLQGSEAVLLFDNGSTDYPAQAVVERLAAVPGLKRALVVQAPYPYGPPHGATAKLEVPARFFQTAMLNLARLRMLGRARSVLSLDIDEMLEPLGPRTAHQAAEAGALGLVRLGGHWVFSAQDGGGQAQRAHGHRQDPDSTCNPKWCVCPAKPAGRLPWTVHRILGEVDRLFLARDQRFHHCFQTSTGWKSPRDAVGKRQLVPDSGLAALWSRVLDGADPRA